MGKNIQLSITKPCHEHWDKMSAAEKGRFCDSCQKQVIDFTNMGDSQIAAFFKKKSTGSVCGRFFQDQLDRDMEIPQKRIPWVKYFFQFVLPAFLLSAKASAQGKAKVAKPNTVMTPPASILLGDVDFSVIKQEKMIIKGRVLDNNDQPVSYANVSIKGTYSGVEADSNGYFRLERPVRTNITLTVSCVGFVPTETAITDKTDLKQELVIRIGADNVLDEVIVSSSYIHMKSTSVMGVIGTKTSQTTRIIEKAVITDPAETRPMIKVYPNPLKSGASLNIGCEKVKEGYYIVQLVSQSGQQVLNRQTWIDEEMQVFNIDIPSVASGIYFLKLTNKETKKKYTEKIIVE